jgi:hypothetical protein
MLINVVYPLHTRFRSSPLTGSVADHYEILVWSGSGSGSGDPCLCLMDPDSSIFIIDLQDANKKLI